MPHRYENLLLHSILLNIIFKKNTAMTTHSKVSRKFTATLAIIFFIPPLLLFIAYSGIGVKYGSMSQEGKIESFLSYFPSWMQNYAGINIFSIIFCIIAISLASRSYKKKLLSIRVIMLVIVLASIFIILFDISQLI